VFTLTALEPEEASTRIMCADLHTRQQTLAMLDTDTGEAIEKRLWKVNADALQSRHPASLIIAANVMRLRRTPEQPDTRVTYRILASPLGST